MRSDDGRRLATVHPILSAAYLYVAPRFAIKFPGSFLGVLQGFRTPVDQHAIFAAGRSAFDGKTDFSNHQRWPAAALDPGVFDSAGNLVEDGEDPRYRWMGEQFEAVGPVRWGGHFVHAKPDWDHVELAGVAEPDSDEVVEALAAWARTVAPTVAPFLRVA